MTSHLARRVTLLIYYEKANITKEVNEYLIGFSYTDESSEVADSISIVLEDKEGLWHGSWLPMKGDIIRASFGVENWMGKKSKEFLPCGQFTVDEFSMTGPPDTVEIKGQSVPVKSNIKTPKTKPWKKIKLSQIAADIAMQAGIKLLFECQEDTLYEHIEQIKESNLAFLSKLCKRGGISLKVTDSQIVLFDEATYESKSSELIIIRGESNVLDYGFDGTTNDTAYGSCRIRYKSPKTNKLIEYHYTPKDSNKGPILEISEAVSNKEEARKVAMKRLRSKNKLENTAKFTLLGDIRFIAGVTVTVKGWKVFDGKYIIKSATHNLVGGYTVGLELTKCLEGY